MIPTKEEWNKALVEKHGEELQKKFASATVAICGLGGLGSNIAISLARAGIGKLILIDFDRVDITNLHRQQYKADQIGRYKAEALSENLREIAPYIEIISHTIRIEEDRDNLLDKKIGEELLIDIGRYKQICDTLVCFIYDPDNRLSNPFGLAKDLENMSIDNLKVKIFICPE